MSQHHVSQDWVATMAMPHCAARKQHGHAAMLLIMHVRRRAPTWGRSLIALLFLASSRDASSQLQITHTCRAAIHDYDIIVIVDCIIISTSGKQHHCIYTLSCKFCARSTTAHYCTNCRTKTTNSLPRFRGESTIKRLRGK